MKKKLLILTITAFILGIITYLDFITGYEIAFYVFYAVPIIIITWHLDLIYGIALSIISAIIWGVVDKLSLHSYHHYSILYWNTFVILSCFIIISSFLDRIKSLMIKERKQAKLNSDILSAISHEFNNLLTGIHLSSTLLYEGEEENIGEERQKFYSIIDQNYIAMKQAVTVFLTKARTEEGKLKLNLQRVELRQCIDETVEILMPLILEKKIKIIKEFPNIVKPVNCDRDIITIVLSNLISNAIKYSYNSGTVIIRIKEIENNFVETSIEDNGIGISKNELDKIFSGFYRTQESVKQAKGIGIGLKLSKELLEIHNSNLYVESEKGKGTRFYFILPLDSLLKE